jgi:hypothetical protein
VGETYGWCAGMLVIGGRICPWNGAGVQRA